MFRAAIPITFGILTLCTLIFLAISIESNFSQESLQRVAIPAAFSVMIWSASQTVRNSLTASVGDFKKARDEFQRWL